MASTRAGTMKTTGLQRTGQAPTGGTARNATGASSLMVNAVTISGDDLDNIKRAAYNNMDVFQAKSKADEAEDELKQSRREASKARAGRWPNTLAALRATKTQARKDEIERKEEAQQELDAIEEDLRLQERLATIRKANEYYSRQSDRMKALDNYRQRSYDMEVEKMQAKLKADRKAVEQSREDARFRDMQADVAAAAAEEEARRQAARARAAQCVAEQKAQLHAAVQRRLAELQEQEELGKRMMEATASFQSELAASVTKKHNDAQQRLREFQEDKARLVAERASLKQAEKDMVAWIESQARAKEAQEAKIRSIIEGVRDEAARKATFIRMLMERDFAAKASSEDAILARDIAKAEAKRQAEVDEQARKAGEMKRAILANIQDMKDKTLQRIIEQKEEEAREHAIFLSKLAAFEALEAADVAAKRARNAQFKLVHQAQAADKKRTVEATMSHDRTEMAEANSLAAGGPLDEVFHREVEKVRAEEVARGHDTKPLDRLVHKLLNPPMVSSVGMR